MNKQSDIHWPNINIDVSEIDLSGSDEEIVLRLVKLVNPEVPKKLLDETFEYQCYMAREYYRREEGISSPILTDQEKNEIRSGVVESLQIEAVLRGLSKLCGVEVSEADEEKELFEDTKRTGIKVKQLRKYYQNHPLESNEKYLAVLRKKLLEHLRTSRGDLS